MIFKTIAVPTTPTDLKTLLGVAQDRCEYGVALQAPAANVVDVNFGDISAQPGYIPPGGSSDVLPVNRLDSLYIVGTTGDDIIVMVF